jgi:hypothetical protein
MFLSVKTSSKYRLKRRFLGIFPPISSISRFFTLFSFYTLLGELPQKSSYFWGFFLLKFQKCTLARILSKKGGYPQQSGVLAPEVKTQDSLMWCHMLSQDNMLRGCRTYISGDFNLLRIKDFEKKGHIRKTLNLEGVKRAY